MATERPRARKAPQDHQPKALKAAPEPTPEPEFSQQEVDTAAMQEDLAYQKGQVQYLLGRVTVLRAKVNQQSAEIAALQATQE